MSDAAKPAIIKVALNAPLPQAFDYLPPTDADAAFGVGCRVRVPFGRRREVGVVVELASASDVPRQKLKRADQQLDASPLLRESDLRLARFVSDYYHHPLGECIAAGLPGLLRQGRPLDEHEVMIELSDTGQAVDASDIERRAPRQAEALRLLLQHRSLSDAHLTEQLNGWPRLKSALKKKAWIVEREIVVHPPTERRSAATAPELTLNAEQKHAVDEILKHDGFHVSLLDGITGSGKTEVYLRVMDAVIAAGRQVLILVPEIGLTPQFVGRLERRLGYTPAVLHSSLTHHERLAAWRAARSGEARIVLGTRSAVFTPLKAPGLIVVDEEHDTSLKQQEGLRYSARDLSVVRAKHLDVPVILGSATPSLESIKHASSGAYSWLSLTERAGGAVPPLMRLVDLSRFPSADGLSAPLLDAIERHLGNDGQVLVFLNRRGYAPTLICASCGHIAECQRCDSRMTVHRATQSLSCHHCGAQRALDPSCAECGAQVNPLGQGTERVEEALRARFPAHSIARIDSDSTRLKGAMNEALAAAQSGSARILVGTQLLSKGHHFPSLSLVGVVNADQGLFSTDFRGAERLAQSLVQVAGRAGRERQQGEVLVQTAFPKHAFWKALFTGGYHEVARLTALEREASGWPPYSHLAMLRASAHQRSKTFDFLDVAAQCARLATGDDVRVLGPVSAPMERRAGRYRGQLLLQSSDRRALHRLLRKLVGDLTSDVRARRVRWSIDVDPIELF